MTESLPSCAVLVLNYQGQDILARHLPSVVEAARPAGHRVIVVDNGSTDGSREVAEGLGCEFLACAENRFLVSLNQAAREVDAEVIFTLNNDLSVEPDCFERMRAHFAHPRVFGVTARTFWIEDRATLQFARTTGRFEHGLIDPVHHVGWLTEDPDRGPAPTLYCGGGSAAWRRSVFLELGGFDPLFHPLYWEDVDLSYSAWRRGWISLYDPAAVVYHADSTTVKRNLENRRVDQIKLRNRYLLSWKNLDDPGLLWKSLRTWAHELRGCRDPRHRWKLPALLGAARRAPRALWRRSALPPAVIPDREILPELIPGWIRAGLGRATPFPGDLWDAPPGAPAGPSAEASS